MFKAPKGSKDIVKIVHLTSVVQPEFYEATRILFVCKENKNNFIQQFFSSMSVFATAFPAGTKQAHNVIRRWYLVKFWLRRRVTKIQCKSNV